MNLNNNDLFCHDLPTNPQPGIGKILVTGATGYIGGRLVPELLARGYSVRVIVRAVSREHEERWPEADIVVADALNLDSLKEAFRGIHTAYYLIHSLLFIPYWARTECQPISVRDVIKYLVGVLERPETSGESFDIGGKDIVSYETMLKTMAGLLMKKVLFIPSFFSHMSLYAYIANLATPVPNPIVRSLLEGIKSKVVCQNNKIRDAVPFEPLTFKEAILGAMTREEHDKVYTRWSDAYPPAHVLAIKLHELETPPRYTSACSLISHKSASLIFSSVCRIGGNEGWFKNNWMWRLRGLIDRILTGVGTARGRRSATRLRINDVIDFWRVEDLKINARLLLRAEMKLPGRAWLEFNIEEDDGKNRLTLKAHYQPRGLFGKIYWYIFMPFHNIIFDDLLKQIVKRG